MVKEVDIGTARVDKRLVGMLEDILEGAKKGDIVSAGVVLVYSNRCTGNAFSDGYPVCLLGETIVLQREITDFNVSTRLHEPGEAY